MGFNFAPVNCKGTIKKKNLNYFQTLNSYDFYLLLNSDLQILASLNHSLLSQDCNGCDSLIENKGK